MPAAAPCFVRCKSDYLLTRDFFDEVQVNQSLDWIYRRHDDADPRTRSQTPSLATPRPRMAIGLHHVLVITQVVQMKQPIHANVEYLHEATKLHYCRDDSVESLTYALSQV